MPLVALRGTIGTHWHSTGTPVCASTWHHWHTLAQHVHAPGSGGTASASCHTHIQEWQFEGPARALYGAVCVSVFMTKGLVYWADSTTEPQQHFPLGD